MADVAINNSILLMEGTEQQQKLYSDLIDKRRKELEEDKQDRKRVYKVRNDFYVGNQASYTNIVGLKQKEKQGHANSIINYAGKTVVKIAYGLANNPPKLDFPVDSTFDPIDPDYDTEEVRTQATEDFTVEVFKRNRLWLKAYRRGVFNQVKVGDFAIKIYPLNIGTKEQPVWDIKIINHEKMENLLVGWRGDDSKEFDFVIAEELRSLQSIKEEYGIDVDPRDIIEEEFDQKGTTSSHNNDNQWGMKNLGSVSVSLLPAGKNKIPSAWVREYDDEYIYAIKIGSKLVQLVIKGTNMPKIKFWVLGENIPNTGSHWSIADIDYLIDPQIELNEASNEERDYIRVGANQKFVAYNMEDFDPESVKTGSGGVIFVSSPDGTAKFEPLQTNVNNYPADSYLNRMKKHIHDLGIPEVGYGSGSSESGRRGAIDYQTIVDLIDFKQDSWELAILDICEKVQRLGSFYFQHDYFNDAKTNEFKVRLPDFNWTDIVPITAADKIVNVVNKVQMGLPFRIAYKELGYRDIDNVVAEMKKEAQDKDLMMFRSKMWQLASGIAQAQMQNQQMLQQTMTQNANPNEQTAGPTLTPTQNQGREASLPMAQRGGTTSFSSAKGFIDQTKQNIQAQRGI